ncbi:MAG TPA: hypothetical protein DDW52_24180 [Planctomycetaceae bacterium]|nr:hypothetical protein [Planctomycetaceae bacterium]
MKAFRTGTLVVAVLVALLIILHQDNWLWESETLVGGVLPIGLFYHACISVAASATWLLATKVAWPLDSDSSGPKVPSSDAEGK